MFCMSGTLKKFNGLQSKRQMMLLEPVPVLSPLGEGGLGESQSGWCFWMRRVNEKMAEIGVS